MDKLTLHTADRTDKNIAAVAALFPNTLTEVVRDGKTAHAIDFDMLRQELSGVLVEGPEERYTFNWPDKRKSVLLANMPNYKTLRPCREESVNFDTTENLYIEGDNIDVLKLLQETYLGKVKMIYIDPPYNTGRDAFVYDDDYSETIAEYNEDSGDYDEDGYRMYQNLSTNGRFHTDWLNMIYPRLKVAKDLLRDDGVIFISIDDNEIHNLRKVCDEIFGAWNFVNIISINMKNAAGASGGGEDKRLKKNCEFALIYAKNYIQLPLFKSAFEYTELYEVVQQYRSEEKNWHYTSVLVESGEKIYVGSTVDGDGNDIKIYKHPSAIVKSVRQLMKDENLSEKEVYYRYGNKIFEAKDAQSSIRTRVIKAREQLMISEDILSIEYIPKSGRNKGVLYEQYYKGDKCRLFAWLSDITETIDDVLYKKDKQGTYWDFTSSINNLTREGEVSFPNGKKPIAMIKRMIEMATDEDSMILDFFSGSATTAHAVMQLNAEDGGNRKFIMVQIPEECNPDSEAAKAEFHTICDIGKERLRRAGKRINDAIDEGNRQLKSGEDPRKPVDIGFRVLKVDSTNMKDVYYQPEELTQTMMDETIDNIKEGRTPEDLLFQVLLDLGVLLSCRIEQEVVCDKQVFTVCDGGECTLIACFDEGVTAEAVTEIAKRKPHYAVFRDSGMSSDSLLTSFEQIFETYSKNTVRKVL